MMQRGFSLISILVLMGVLIAGIVGYLMSQRVENPLPIEHTTSNQLQSNKENTSLGTPTSTPTTTTTQPPPKKQQTNQAPANKAPLKAPFELSDFARNDGTITSPQQGQILLVGRSYEVRWNVFSKSSAMRADLIGPGGEAYTALASGIPETIENTGQFTWEIPTSYLQYLKPGKYYIKISCVDDGCATDGKKDFRFSDTFYLASEGAQLGIASKEPERFKEIQGPQENISFGEYVLDAREATEDIKISSINLRLDSYEPDLVKACRILDGLISITTGVNTISPFPYNPALGPDQAPSYQFFFDKSLVIKRGTYKTIFLQCNVQRNATYNDFIGAGITWSVDIYSNNEAVGVASGKTYEPFIYSPIGQVFSIGF